MRRSIWIATSLLTLSGWAVAAFVLGAMSAAYKEPYANQARLLDLARLQLDVCQIDSKAWEKTTRDMWDHWKDKCTPDWDGDGQ